MLNAKHFSMAAALATAILFAATAEAQFTPMVTKKSAGTISTAGKSYGNWYASGTSYDKTPNGGGYVEKFGPSDAKLTFALYPTAHCEAKQLHSGMNSPYGLVVADVRAPISVKLYGKSYSIFSLRATGRLERGQLKYKAAIRKYDYYDTWLDRSTYVNIQVGPFTLCDGWSSSNQSYDKSHTKALYEGEDVTMCGFVPVHLQWGIIGNYGYGAGVSTNRTNFEAKVYGYGKGEVYLFYYAGLGVPGASVGLQADCTLMDTTITPNVFANLNAGGGKIDFVIRPLKLALKLVLHYAFWSKPFTIWSWSKAKVEKPIPLF